MKKFILLLVLLLPFSGWGKHYNAALLQIGAKLFPKVVLMEKGTKEYIKSDMVLIFVTSPSNIGVAGQLKEMMMDQYKNGIGDVHIAIKTVSPKEGLNIKNGHAVIFLTEPEENIEGVVKYLHSQKILTFSVDSILLEQGVAVSIDIGRSVKPYINLSTLKQVPFTFEYGFLKLSKIFEN